MKHLIAKFWPMKFICHRFVDSVNGRDVNWYMQIDGKVMLAQSRWALFRVEVKLWSA